MAHPTTDRNFRLPQTVRPARYQAHLSIDLDAKRFTGEATIELSLGEPAQEVVLHGVDLEVDRAVCRSAGRALAATRVEVAKASETLLLRFPEPVPAGPASLELAWRGKMCDGLRGLYHAGPVAVTQFEAADARRVFPCFDEPAFKAVWSVSVDVPEGAVALGNGPAVREEVSGGRKRVEFAETPPLSSYLVALCAGALAPSPAIAVRNVPVRTWAVAEKARLAAFGQEVAVEVLPRLEDYFGLPYAFGKLDQVAVPDFEAGAMENAGLVTFREVALLLDPATASLAQKKRVAEVVTHELAHMWFGNWVTMQWWDDLWLNEAFATWMAFKVVDGWMPGWRVWLEFDTGKAAALHLDALRSTHPIHAYVKNAAEATESFDVITYEKGGAVLRMIESYLGEVPFREGIRAYMRKHGRANAVADDLWSALAEASGQPILELANDWIRQPGFPLVSVGRDGARLRLEQRRFFSAPGESGPGRWPVPLVLRYEDDAGVKTHRALLRDRSAVVELPAQGRVRWVCANGGATGFYRVAYEGAALADLRHHLAKLEPSERIQLVADEWALVRAAEREVGVFLDLCAAFGAEQDHAVLDELVGRLAAIEHRLVADSDRPRFQAWVAALFGPRFEEIGWNAQPGEPDAIRLRRSALVRALGLVARLPALVEEGAARLDRFLAGDPHALEANLHEAAVAMAARMGGAARFEQLRELYRNERDPAFRRRYLLALAQFEEPSLARRGEALAFDGSVPLQDLASYMATLLGNRSAREAFWVELQARFEEVRLTTAGAPMLLRRVIEALGALPERRHLDEATTLLQIHPVEAARQAAAQTLERMRQDVELRERTQAAIGRWLAARRG
ncbi:M1 family metallopeptidase [Anaeromyxobacter paludicola]|uniref:Aminopeptidase n=1 Tax=Anaeromyxobacter paludicola TaxID=2918171 RepID=A0ABM7X7W0_9BACT|nr:M1 family metallopeptidase [Anaeromyxobacter paludicola]BDG07929.1 aminopeptidase [Anaeromyxobacter paludicola]